MMRSFDLRIYGNDERGFTLLEILIALFVFSILAVMISGALHSILQTQSQTEKKSTLLREIQFALLLFSRDVGQIIDRPVVNAKGEMNGFMGQQNQSTFTHTGLVNPDDQLHRPTLQRTQYALVDHQFVRITWPLPDQTAKSVSEKRVLLNDVDELTLSYLDKNNHFYDIWPPANENSEHLPRAVRIVISLHNWGKITQIYPIPGHDFAKTE